MHNKDMRLNFYFSLNVNGKRYTLMEKKTNSGLTETYLKKPHKK